MTRAVNQRELAVALAFAALAAAPFLGEAYHLDEPFFLAVGRQIAADPWHPFAFSYNGYGRLVPAGGIINTPPLLGYLLAAAGMLAGGREWAMRLALLPLDLVSAGALYLIAARFLARPLLPTLVALAGPAYLINMGHLMAEKPAAAFGFAGLCALIYGVDERRPGWYWASCPLLAAASMSKYNAALLFFPAAAYQLERKVPARRIAAQLALAAAPLAAYLAWDLATGSSAIGGVWAQTAWSLGSWWSGWAHRLRAFLSFTGGCALASAAWPFLLERRRGVYWACAAAVAVLFLPALDLAPLVRPVDRLAGAILSGAALLALAWLFGPAARAHRGWALWAPWTAAVVVVQTCLYWSVMARMILFLIPPLTFALAEAFEARRSGPALKPLYAASLAAALALSWTLGAVDYRYAQAQKSYADAVAGRYLSSGRRVWCLAHWGLQYYLERAGAVELDWSRGGWEQVRPGDVVVLTKVDSQVFRPVRPLAANVSRLTLDSAIPLRLISGWSGEGGFYSSVSGFLPFSLSREPLEEFTTLEAL